MATTPSTWGLPSPSLFKHGRVGVCIFHIRLGRWLAIIGFLMFIGTPLLALPAVIALISLLTLLVGLALSWYFGTQLKKAQG